MFTRRALFLPDDLLPFPVIFSLPFVFLNIFLHFLFPFFTQHNGIGTVSYLRQGEISKINTPANRMRRPPA
jgi:hypothetical protein